MNKLFWPLAVAALLPSTCLAQNPGDGPYNPGVAVGKLQDPAVKESSGIAASRRSPGLFWTHNDSGDGPFVYAVGPHGERRGTFQVRGAGAVTDCEDMAVGPGPSPGVSYLYLADIGDNNANRRECVVWRFPEPPIPTTPGPKPVLTQTADALRFTYPDGPHDAETLLVHPKSGRIAIVAKNKSGDDGVYAFPMPLSPSRTVTLVKVATIHISGEPSFHPNLVTGGSISPDGRRVALRTYWYVYEFAVPSGRPFDALWQTKPILIVPPLQGQGEGISYTRDGKSLILTSEGAGSDIEKLTRK